MRCRGAIACRGAADCRGRTWYRFVPRGPSPTRMASSPDCRSVARITFALRCFIRHLVARDATAGYARPSSSAKSAIAKSISKLLPACWLCSQTRAIVRTLMSRSRRNEGSNRHPDLNLRRRRFGAAEPALYWRSWSPLRQLRQTATTGARPRPAMRLRLRTISMGAETRPISHYAKGLSSRTGEPPSIAFGERIPSEEDRPRCLVPCRNSVKRLERHGFNTARSADFGNCRTASAITAYIKA